MKWILPLVAFLPLSTAVLAQAPEARVSYCGPGFVGPFGQQRAPVDAVVSIKVADWHALESQEDLISNLEIGYRAAVEHCRRRYPTNPMGNVSASVYASIRVIITARKPESEGIWTINLDLRPQLRDEERKEAERRQKEAEEKERLAKAQADEQKRQADAQAAYERRIKESRALFDQFNAKADVADWPDVRALLTAPLKLRGKVVAFRARLAEDRVGVGSVLSVDGGLILVSGSPATLRPNAELPLLIAGALVGVKRIDWRGQTISIPELQYRDGYACKLNDCEDALFWMNPKK
jgi:hypothetical protein